MSDYHNADHETYEALLIEGRTNGCSYSKDSLPAWWLRDHKTGRTHRFPGWLARFASVLAGIGGWRP